MLKFWVAFPLISQAPFLFVPVLNIEGDTGPVFASFARPVLHADSHRQSRIEPHLVVRSSGKKLLNPAIQGFGVQFHDFESTLRVTIFTCQLPCARSPACTAANSAPCRRCNRLIVSDNIRSRIWAGALKGGRVQGVWFGWRRRPGSGLHPLSCVAGDGNKPALACSTTAFLVRPPHA